MAYFGFIPSKKLLSKIQIAIHDDVISNTSYILRDEIALLINEELIDAIFTRFLEGFPDNHKRQTAEKLAQFIKSSSSKLLKQLLEPASHQVVQESHLFLKNHLFESADGVVRLGEFLEKDLIQSLKCHFKALKQGKIINLSRLTQDYKQFSDITIQHYMYEFHQTLNLGLFKRKASSLGCIAVKKAILVALDQLLPKLTQDELNLLAHYHDNLFFE